jgi:hypothetical protein
MVELAFQQVLVVRLLLTLAVAAVQDGHNLVAQQVAAALAGVEMALTMALAVLVRQIEAAVAGGLDTPVVVLATFLLVALAAQVS